MIDFAAYYAIVFIVVAGIIAIAVIMGKRFGISPPSWVVQILWTICAVLVGVAAVRIIVWIVRG